jgi:hypothetical protein
MAGKVVTWWRGWREQRRRDKMDRALSKAEETEAARHERADSHGQFYDRRAPSDRGY